MPRGAGPCGVTVPDLLNKCQEGVGGHTKYAKLLWDLVQTDCDLCWPQLSTAVKHLLCVPEVGALACWCSCPGGTQKFHGHLKQVHCLQKTSKHAEKALVFLAAFCGYQASERAPESEQLVETLVWEVLEFVSAVDKVVRTRACQLLTLILNQLPELDEQLSGSIQAALLARLKDKLPAVRAFAATSVVRLVDPQEVITRPLQSCGGLHASSMQGLTYSTGTGQQL